MKFRAEASRSPWKGSIELFLGGVGQDGRRYVVKPLEGVHSAFEDVTECDMISRGPAIDLSESEAQALLDSLYHAGLRPSQDVPLAETFAAKDAHLADLRRLLFDDPRTRPAGQVETGPAVKVNLPGPSSDLGDPDVDSF